MGYVILFRNTMNGKIGVVEDTENESIVVFETEEEAEAAAERVPVCWAYPFSIVEAP
jgi:hypothetical protein